MFLYIDLEIFILEGGRMELRDLRTFITVVRECSFSKAAVQLGYSQAAVTIQIRQLEDELGIRLFDRLGRQIQLTNRGRLFFDHVQCILDELAEAQDSVKEDTELTGSLTVGTIDSLCSYLFPRIIGRYHELYPRVTLTVLPDTPSVLLDALNKNELDIVYLLDMKRTDPLWVKVLDEPEEAVFVTSSQHPLAQKPSPGLDEVLASQFILTEKEASYRRILDLTLNKSGREIHPFLQTRNTDLIITLLEQNRGVSFLPRLILEDRIASGVFSVLDVPGVAVKVWRQVFYRRNKWVTREMNAFFDLVRSSSLRPYADADISGLSYKGTAPIL